MLFLIGAIDGFRVTVVPDTNDRCEPPPQLTPNVTHIRASVTEACVRPATWVLWFFS